MSPRPRFFLPSLFSLRRRALLVVIAAGFLLPGCSGNGDVPRNVLLVIVDTLRADRVVCYGYPNGRTPNMDQLASEGHRFDHAISQVPVTCPSISTILTGTYPQYHGIRDNGRFELSPSVRTLAEVFSDNGFRTAAFVSASVIERKYGLYQGFDVYDDDVSMPFKFYNPRFTVKTEEHQDVERRADETTNRAVSWLREHKKDPFFLVVHYFDPHDPYDPPPAYQGIPGGTNYDGEVHYADDNIGRLRQALEWDDLLDQTLIVVTADHGEGLGEHGELSHGFFLYDTTMRVPMIFRGPGVAGEGGVTEQVVRLVDIAPTVIDLVGLDPAAAGGEETFGQGRSLAPVLRNEAPLPAEPAYMETYRVRYSYNWHELVGLRTERWKYIRAPRSELYDLEADPHEETNLFERNPDEAEELSRRLDHLLLRTTAESPLAGGIERDAETKRKMEALGYVSTSPTDEMMSDEESDSLPDPKDGVKNFTDRQLAKDKIWEGKTMLQQGKMDEARVLIHEALEISPRLPIANFNMGLFCHADGKFDEAKKYFRKAAEYDPGFTRAWSALAFMAYEEGRDEDCRRDFLKAYESDPNSNTGFRLLFAYLRTGAFEEGHAFLGEVLEDNPHDGGAVNAIGLLYAAQGRYDDEERYWTDVAGKDQENKTATYRLNRLEVWRASPGAFRLLADGRFAESVAPLEMALEEHPDSGPLAGALAWALIESGGDLERAEGLIQRAEKANPADKGFYLRTEGALLIARGRAEQAEQTLARAARELEGVYEPFLTTLRFYQGKAAEKAGKPDAARSLYTRALVTSLDEEWEPEAMQGGGKRRMLRRQHS